MKKVEEQTEISRFNGQDSYIIEVMKTQDSNTADVANAVKESLNDFQKKADVNLFVILDQGKEVEKSISTLVKEGLFGALFTLVVILLFLRNIRATLIAILSLPLSIFATIAVLNQMGLTLNIMTLGGLAVSVGRIVDDSIVIIENTYRWKQKNETLNTKQLVYKATNEVLSPVASSTVATVVVFLPLAYVSGIIGEFFRPFAIAVVVSILSSLLVAIMVIPVLGNLFFKNIKHVEKEGKFIKGFERLITGSLRKKWIVIASSIIILVGSLGMIPLIGVSFLPTGTEPSVSVDLELPSEVNVDKADQLLTKVEAYLGTVKHVDYSQVSYGQPKDIWFGSGNKTNTANVFVQFNDNQNMDERISTLQKHISKIVKESYSEAVVNAKEVQQQGPPSGNNIEINLYGEVLDDLQVAAQNVQDLLEQHASLKNISNNLKDVQPKWVLSINEEGKAANINAYQVMDTVSKQLRPTQLGVYELNQKQWDLSIFYDEKISSKSDIETIKIPTAMGVKQLKDIVTIKETTTPTTISHQMGRMNAKITATIKGDTAAVTKEVEQQLQSLQLPNTVELQVGGGMEMMKEGFANLGLAMAIAVGLVFLVLSITFGGLRNPLVILTSLIFVPVGSLGGLILAGETLSMSAMIGMLMLIGIVVTNAVVLLQRIEENRKAGSELTEAIVEATKTRLRPILMTAFATIFALIPLALSESTSGMISKGLAIMVIGGLTTSTLLTLIVVPTIYSLLNKKKSYDNNF